MIEAALREYEVNRGIQRPHTIGKR